MQRELSIKLKKNNVKSLSDAAQLTLPNQMKLLNKRTWITKERSLKTKNKKDKGKNNSMSK